MKFYLFKDLSIRFKDCWEKLKDFSRTWTIFSIFKDFSRGWCFFKDYSRPVRTMYLPCCVSHENRKYSLTLDNFSLSSQQLVPNYFLYPSKVSDVYLQEILAQFPPNKHSFATRRHLAIVETRLKSWKRRTAENYSRSILMLLTCNRLHFSWSYWLPKILLLPYTCDGIKDAVLTASTKSKKLFSHSFCEKFYSVSVQFEQRKKKKIFHIFWQKSTYHDTLINKISCNDQNMTNAVYYSLHVHTLVYERVFPFLLNPALGASIK